MKQSYLVDKISLAPRQDNANGFTVFNIEGSTNGTTWTTLGSNLIFSPGTKSFQDYSITATQIRYLKVTALRAADLSNTSTHLGEINVYSY